jgi:hypothetical protein
MDEMNDWYDDYYCDVDGNPLSKAQEKRVDAYLKQVAMILHLIRREAKQGTLYTPKEFSTTFAGQHGLKSWRHIYGRLQCLASKGMIGFNKQRLSMHQYGHLCVIGMVTPFDPKTLELTMTLHPMIPTHKKNQSFGFIEPVNHKDKEIWETPYGFLPLRSLIGAAT